MTIKKLEGKERFEAYKLAAFSFHKRLENIEEECEKREAETLEDWGAFDDDGNLMARVFNRHYDFYLDGQAVKTGGIGAVATYPEYRESGAVRALFSQIIPEVYNNGEILSALFPFNHKFYRKFGYEVVPFENEYKLKPELLADYSTTAEGCKCKIKRWQTGESVGPFLEVYTSFASKFNLSAVRDEEMMLKHIKYEKEYIDRKFSYLFSYDGRAVAYLIFTDVFNPEAAVLKVEECAWTCREGFNAVLNFLSRFSADYGSITIPLPKGIDLLKIIRAPNAYDIENSECQHFMLRVVNAKKLLEKIRKPKDCDFTLKIEDEMIKENNVSLRVMNDCVEPVPEKDKCDIELNVRSLAQLASGCTSIDEAALRPDVTINGNEEMLKKTFVAKSIFVSEDF